MAATNEHETSSTVANGSSVVDIEQLRLDYSQDQRVWDLLDEVERLHDTLRRAAAWWELLKKPAHPHSAEPFTALDMLMAEVSRADSPETQR